MTSRAELAVHCQGLSKQFGDYWAVKDLALSIRRGEIYGFLGPNGCGKSTTIRMLTGLLTPSAGDVQLFGQPLASHVEQLRQNIGYMTQKFSLYETLSVRENLDFVGQIYGIASKPRQQRLQELLATYHLQDKAKVLAGALSGGQKQRLALAAATFHQPQLLFLDEPTSAVDPENRREFWERLFDLSDAGTTILVSTHYMDEAERCHRLAILEQGQKRADGSPIDLMAAMPVSVFEVEGDDLRQLRRQLLSQAWVISAAQLGMRLRVLVDKACDNAEQWLAEQLPSGYRLAAARANLEDVFVANTGSAYEQLHHPAF